MKMQRFCVRGIVGRPSSRKRLITASCLASILVIILTILVLVLIAGSVSAIEAPPPGPPVVVSDGTGGAIIFGPHKPYERDLYAQHIDAQGNRLWGEKGKQIGVKGAGVSWWAVSDDAGGAIAVHSRIIERLDSQGNVVWTKEGLITRQIAQVISDSSGGALLLLYSGDDAYVQRISTDGVRLWAEDDVYIGKSVEQFDTDDADIAGDGYGGAVVIWRGKSIENEAIYAQWVSNEGKKLWSDDGVLIVATPLEKAKRMFYKPQIINEGAASFVITWASSSASPYDVGTYTQKLNGNGQFLWDKPGIFVCDDTGIRLNPDGSGGCIVTWHERRNTYAQKVTATGETMWRKGTAWLWYRPHSYSQDTYIKEFYMVGDGVGGAIVVWTTSLDQVSIFSNSRTYAQRLSSDGQILWSDRGTIVYDDSFIRFHGDASITSDGSGGVIIGSWISKGSRFADSTVYVQRINSEGQLIWGKSGMQAFPVYSSPILPIIAVVFIITAILILVGVAFGNSLSKLLSVIVPVIMGVTALLSEMLLAFKIWGITDTPPNLLSVVAIPIIGIVIGAFGIRQSATLRWLAVIGVVLCALLAVLYAFLIFVSF
jgi:hypothetical protein